MNRLNYRIARLEQHPRNDRTCPVCQDTGRPFIGVDGPPRPESYEDWLAHVQWERQFEAEHKRPEAWCAVVADGNREVERALVEILAKVRENLAEKPR